LLEIGVREIEERTHSKLFMHSNPDFI